jgi:hypothetical protein
MVIVGLMLIGALIGATPPDESGREPAGDARPDAAHVEVTGVVRVVRGRTTSPMRGGRSIALHTADLIASGQIIETDGSGWAEIQLRRVGRLRLSASTRIAFARTESGDLLRLESGRVWIEHSGAEGPFEVLTPNARSFILGKSSVIVEYTRSAGSTVSVREGSATFLAKPIDQLPITVGPGQVAVLAQEAKVLSPARAGGAGVGDLAAQEAQSALGDLIGLKAFLLERVQLAQVKGFEPRGVTEIIRSAAEIEGGDSGPAGAAIEGGLRPAPFFENEVPPRGPNVRVRVTFGD